MLELSVPPDALLDEGLAGARARGAGEQPDAVWRARLRDDDGRVWRAVAETPAALGGAWIPAKASSGAVAALASLRPVTVEVRVELPDGRSATREVTRRLLADGVLVRRWRDAALTATLLRPAGDGPFPGLVVDATAGEGAAGPATVAAALLASRGVVVLVVPPQRAAGPAGVAAERLAALPFAAAAPRVLPAAAVALPPFVPARGAAAGPQAAAVRAAGWDALLATLGAAPRIA